MRVISGSARGHQLKAPQGMTTRPMSDKIKGAVFSMLSNLLNQLDRDWGRVLDLYSGTGSIGIEALSRGASWADFVEINAGVCRIISANLEHTHLRDKARVNNRTVAAFLNSPPAPPGASAAKRAAGGLHRRKGGAHRSEPEIEIQPHHLSFLLTPEEARAEQLQRNALTEEVASEPIITPDIDNAITQEERQYAIIFLDPPYADPKIPDTLTHLARSGLAQPGGLVVIGHSPRVTLAEVYGEMPSGQLHRLRYRRHGDSAFSIFIAGEPTSFGLNGPAEAEDEAEAESDLAEPTLPDYEDQ